jgi:hypothetical protein
LVHNHLSTVHAIASCDAAEMAMGMLMEATARIDPPDFLAITEGAELVVPINVADRFGAEVVHADITTWVTPA